MLILPIVNNKRVMNVEIRLKGASKVRQGVRFNDAQAGDIIVNREKYSDSNYHSSRGKTAPVDFIRSRSILYPRNFLVTTRQEDNSTCYDVYQVSQPPKKVNDELDELYSKAITDLTCEIPGKESRGRYVSLQDLGFDKTLSNEKIEALQHIIKEERNSSTWGEQFQKAGITDLPDTVSFLNHFEYTILSDTTIPEESLQDTLKAMSAINTRDYRNLKKYYRMAQSNADLYTKISYVSKIVFDKPLSLRGSSNLKQRQYVKRKDDGDYPQAA